MGDLTRLAMGRLTSIVRSPQAMARRLFEGAFGRDQNGPSCGAKHDRVMRLSHRRSTGSPIHLLCPLLACALGEHETKS